MKNKGFTLVEVLVAVIIVMVLAGYSVLKYTDMIYEGKNKKAKAQLEVVAGAYKKYLMEKPSAGAEITGGVVTLVNGGKCAVGTHAFYCGNLDWPSLNYKITLYNQSAGASCSDTIATLTPNGYVGKKFEGSCAYIDRYGRAVDEKASAS